MSRRLRVVGFLALLVVGSPLLAQAGKGGAMKFEIYRDAAKEYRWRLKAPNGQIVASASEGYKAKADCEKAIESIKKGAAGAKVEDMT